MKVSLSIFNSNKGAQFVFKLLAFFLLLIVADWGIGSAVGLLYRNAPYGANWTKENWLLNERYDVVVFGSSRALRHYVPNVISQETGLSVFNAGQNGQYLLYSYALEQLLLDEYKPKLIVLDILPSFIFQTENPDEEFERLSTLSPFIKNTKVRRLLTRGHFFEGLKYGSRLYLYNSKILSILKNISAPQQNVIDGYEVMGDLRFHDRNPFIVDQLESASIDSYKLGLLKKFIADAHEENIQVIAVFSPVSGPLSERTSAILEIYADIFKSSKTPFLNFTTDDYGHFVNKELFLDIIHMDGIGAEQFSIEFSQRLSKEYLIPTTQMSLHD